MPQGGAGLPDMRKISLESALKLVECRIGPDFSVRRGASVREPGGIFKSNQHSSDGKRQPKTALRHFSN
jgi:hypothetical protein